MHEMPRQALTDVRPGIGVDKNYSEFNLTLDQLESKRKTNFFYSSNFIFKIHVKYIYIETL